LNSTILVGLVIALLTALAGLLSLTTLLARLAALLALLAALARLLSLLAGLVRLAALLRLVVLVCHVITNPWGGTAHRPSRSWIFRSARTKHKEKKRLAFGTVPVISASISCYFSRGSFSASPCCRSSHAEDAAFPALPVRVEILIGNILVERRI
jgi:hypothetical protein